MPRSVKKKMLERRLLPTEDQGCRGTFGQMALQRARCALCTLEEGWPRKIALPAAGKQGLSVRLLRDLFWGDVNKIVPAHMCYRPHIGDR